MEDYAISVKNLNKIYRLYERPKDRLIEALGLSGKRKRHREHYALRGVDLDIRRGETVGIIGTNGSGKSTLLKIITGVLTPSFGEVEVNGRISALLELGAGFNMEYNGLENIYLNGTMTGFSKEEIDERLEDILNFADIGDYVYQPVKTYSSGMFVRLAFAMSINIDPEILIVDEALSVGDVFFQAKCYHKFEEFKKQGKTILFVSHDLSSVSKYCDRAVLLLKGEKLSEGSPRDIIDLYKQVLVGEYSKDGNTRDQVRSIEEHEQEELKADSSREPEKGGAEAENTRQAVDQTGDEENSSHEDPSEQPVADGSQALAGSEEETGSQKDGGEEGHTSPLEYGSGAASIIEYEIIDDRGVRTNAVIKGSEFTVRMVVRFNEDIPGPIFACTLKNAMGIELTGTNSMLEKAYLESARAGQVMEATFTQKMELQGGEYLVSLGLTGYEKDDFKVYHRLYDIMDLAVISDKNTVGYFDMNTVMQVRELQG